MSVSAEHIIVALDRATPAENLGLIDALDGRAVWFKVGMRLFYAGGDRVIDAVRASGAKLFLDLKLHDIPATVRGAAESLSRYEAELLTVHASGGAAMVEAACEGVGRQTRVLAVTALTSLDDVAVGAIGWAGTAGAVTDRLASLALAAGAHGLVCSGHEASHLRASFGPSALLVTPGIRPEGAAAGDQKRVMTPEAAVEAGSNYLVIGRPIHGAADPAVAFDGIVGKA